MKKFDIGPHGIEDWSAMSQNQLARVFGVSGKTMSVRFSEAQEKCPRNTDGSYDLTTVIRWWLSRAQAAAKAGRKDIGRDAPEVKRWRGAKADITEMERDTMAGKLVDKARGEAHIARGVTAFCERMRGLGAVLAPQVESKSKPEIVSVISATVREYLDKLSEDLDVLNTEIEAEEDADESSS